MLDEREKADPPTEALPPTPEQLREIADLTLGQGALPEADQLGRSSIRFFGPFVTSCLNAVGESGPREGLAMVMPVCRAFA